MGFIFMCLYVELHVESIHAVVVQVSMVCTRALKHSALKQIQIKLKNGSLSSNCLHMQSCAEPVLVMKDKRMLNDFLLLMFRL
jgi:hypothetical protein